MELWKSRTVERWNGRMVERGTVEYVDIRNVAITQFFRIIYRAGATGLPKVDELRNSRVGFTCLSVIDHEFRHNIVKVDVVPRGMP